MRISKYAAVPLLAGCSAFPHSFTISSGGKTATCGVDSKKAVCNSGGKSVTIAPNQHRTTTPAPTSRPTPTVTVTAHCKDPDHDHDCDYNRDAGGHK